MTEVHTKLEEEIASLSSSIIILDHEKVTLSKDIEETEAHLIALKDDIQYHELASVCIQELVDQVSTSNIERIETLVNSALASIFFDQDIKFKINQETKRNLNCYSFVTMKDGVEGSIYSFGGGIMAVEAMVLKILFNLLSKRYPLLILDESLSFVSEKYIEGTSNFMKELSEQFDIPIVLVTHQDSFTRNADNEIQIEKENNKTTITHN